MKQNSITKQYFQSVITYRLKDTKVKHRYTYNGKLTTPDKIKKLLSSVFGYEYSNIQLIESNVKKYEAVLDVKTFLEHAEITLLDDKVQCYN